MKFGWVSFSMPVSAEEGFNPAGADAHGNHKIEEHLLSRVIPETSSTRCILTGKESRHLEPNASAYWGRRPSVAADLASALHRGLHVSLPSLTYLPAQYGRPAAHG